MFNKACLSVLVVMLCLAPVSSWAGERVEGIVTDTSGDPLRGVMVSVISDERQKSISVFSGEDGRFVIENIGSGIDRVRARSIEFEDTFAEIPKGSVPLHFTMEPAKDINMQRRGDNLFNMVKFDSEEDRMNFKMYCTYCHQIGTVGFRTPEEPVDWETMVTRMEGFAGLFEHSRNTIVQRLLDAYSPEAMENWPEYEIPERPAGKVLDARITEWDMGKQDATMVHDLEPGLDGKIYAVDMLNDLVMSLDPVTDERNAYRLPGGKDPETDDAPRKGVHSIERDADGNMWLTLALSGEMAKFDVTTKETDIIPGLPTGTRAGYPHSLRIDQKGFVWWTDAGMGEDQPYFGLSSINPDTYEVVGYDLPSAGQAVNASEAFGESSGITPYGVDIAPDGKVWYSKLNGNRIGRIDPSVPEGNVKEWNPPFRGPRRLHVAPDGLVWVPGYGSGTIASFDPETEKWDVIDVPNKSDQFPYALNIHPETGDIWVTGTSNDTLLRYIPSEKKFYEYPLPSRVTYTREIEFDADGNVWLCNSNYPVRHTERGMGSFIRIEVNRHFPYEPSYAHREQIHIMVSDGT